jgi:prephenate dehydrogenase
LIALAETLGAHPVPIDADIHDDLVARTSHLPHILAGALTNLVLGDTQSEMSEPFIAGGFRDCTRIAASNPAIWRDILLTNRDRVLTAVEAMRVEFDHWEEAIRDNDAPHLEALLTAAQQRRERLNK